MRVIGEFVDVRTGKRYLPGQGNDIQPAFDKTKDREQIARLIKARVLEEGDEDEAEDQADKKDGKGGPVDYNTLTVAKLKDLAETRQVDLGDAKTKGEIIEALVNADKAAGDK